MPKPQALIEQVRSSVAVELERRHAPTLLADRKAAKAAPQGDAPKKGKGKSGKSKHPGRNEAEDI